MLLQSDLYRMRQQQQKALPGTAVIYRATLTADGMGGQEESWQAVGTVSCRIMPKQLEREELVYGDQRISKSVWVVTLPQGTSVKAEDLLQIDGRTFEVIFVNNSQSYRTAVRVDVVSHNEESLV